jgi:hypothetical protein
MPLCLDLEAGRLPHQAREPPRAERCDLGERTRTMRFGQVGNELMVRQALRYHP